MTIGEARKIVADFNSHTNPTEDEVFMYTEALGFLIEETKDPRYMMELGGYYYEIKRFDLALKYYGMAEALGSLEADVCLGYIWYYGRTGTKDYEKAFKYYSSAMKKGDRVSTYKVADMYRNGYYVEKDPAKYREIIEGLYPKVKHARYVGEPLPEVFTRLAAIRAEDGEWEEAVDLYLKAKDFLAQRIKYSPFFGNFSIMEWLIRDLYKLIDFDEDDADIYDLYYVLKREARVSLDYQFTEYIAESFEEDGETVICFEGKWYRTVTDFFQKAQIGGHLLTDLYGEIVLESVEWK